MKKEMVLVSIIFLAAIFFRLWFITLSPQPFAWDQEEYERYTTKIFYHPQMLASHSYRSYPYPLFMAVVYKFTGFANHEALYKVQAIMDSVTGVLIWLILRLIFPKQKEISYLGYLMYAINPFTSGYVGVGLSEVLSAFFVTVTIFTGLLFVRKPGILMGVLFGFCAGMAAETRNAAFAWAAVPIILAVIYTKRRQLFWAISAVGFGLAITLIYPLYVNWRDFGEVNFTTVDSIFAREFYNGAILKVLPPFTYTYPTPVMQMYWEYYSEYYPGRTTVERKVMADKYFKMGMDIVKADPLDYIRVRFFKMWYVWQKENIFFYKEPFFPITRLWVYWGNIILLTLATIGIIRGFWQARTKSVRYLWASIIGTVLYGTVAFAFSHAEYRLTIPFYPLLVLSAAWGIATLQLAASKITSKKLHS